MIDKILEFQAGIFIKFQGEGNNPVVLTKENDLLLLNFLFNKIKDHSKSSSSEIRRFKQECKIRSEFWFSDFWSSFSLTWKIFNHHLTHQFFIHILNDLWLLKCFQPFITNDILYFSTTIQDEISHIKFTWCNSLNYLSYYL